MLKSGALRGVPAQGVAAYCAFPLFWGALFRPLRQAQALPEPVEGTSIRAACAAISYAAQ